LALCARDEKKLASQQEFIEFMSALESDVEVVLPSLESQLKEKLAPRQNAPVKLT
jgi:hypothetical protein